MYVKLHHVCIQQLLIIPKFLLTRNLHLNTVTTPQPDIYTPEVPETKEPVKNPETEQPESEEAE